MTTKHTIDRVPKGSTELALVASRMRDTLIEVLGEEAGANMYSLDWLLDRASSHVDGRLRGAIYVVRRDSEPGNVGHIVVRKEADDQGNFGLVSTIYVLPELRHTGIATTLLEVAHGWFREQGLTRTATDTSETNRPLIGLFERHGYVTVFHSPEKRMVRLNRDATSAV
ncbi:MAG: GNAT family N-acetyltransferase [Methanobacterium sp.]|nr:GNAT family N-acetyltransferase [Methanobacterium sp.]